jgi:hypothetical protein
MQILKIQLSLKGSENYFVDRDVTIIVNICHDDQYEGDNDIKNHFLL